MIFKTINSLWMCIKYPHILEIKIHKLRKKKKYKQLNLNGFPPNYIYLNLFDNSSTVIDVGCGYEAELSCYLINKYNVCAFAVDPTRKHEVFLKKIEEQNKPYFKHLNFALSAYNGKTKFYESHENESGSLLTTHKNIISDTVKEYEVQLVDLPTLIFMTNKKQIDYLKIDIEGAEYNLFNRNNLDALKSVKQLFIEFHHLSVKEYRKKDTKNIVSVIENEGFSSFSYDGINYLFFNKNLVNNL